LLLYEVEPLSILASFEIRTSLNRILGIGQRLVVFSNGEEGEGSPRPIDAAFV
jgi:hypothetical protein